MKQLPRYFTTFFFFLLTKESELYKSLKNQAAQQIVTQMYKRQTKKNRIKI